jgi:GNAT superfamily N-acetyltransferase
MSGEELRYVNIEPAMAEELEAIELASFPSTDPVDLYNARELRAVAEDFSEGSFAVLDGDRAVAMGTGVRRHFDLNNYQHTMAEFFESGFSGHEADGDWYYGTTITVLPEYRRRGIGQRLYELRKQVCRDYNLRGIIAGGVLPGFVNYKHEMTAAEYVEAVRDGELTDPTLTMQLASGFEVIGVLENYLPDRKSDGWASMIVWHNPDYQGNE